MKYIFLLLALCVNTYAVDKYECVREINNIRSKYGLKSLKLDNNVSTIAQRWADHLSRTGSFTHRSNLNTFLEKYGTITENLFKSNYNPSTKKVITSWMNSPGHRANILDSDSTILGIGISYKNGVYIIVYNGASL